VNDRIVCRLVRGIAASIAMCAFAACGTGPRATPAVAPPLEVEVATVSERDVAISSEWIATLDGYVNAQIRPQVSGYLVQRTYREGALVHKGDVLFEIDPRPFNAALAQARAQVTQAEAQLAKSTRDVERDTPLAEQQAIAQSQLDAEIEAYRAAQANVQSLKAGAEAAALNVEFTREERRASGAALAASRSLVDWCGAGAADFQRRPDALAGCGDTCAAGRGCAELSPDGSAIAA
jgi:multidrug efflux pump subunit AcrA (membrane-fusion protein)